MPISAPQLASSGLSSDAAGPPLDSQKRWIIITLVLIMFTHTMDFMVLMPLGPQLIELFQITPQQFSFLVSIYSFTAGICGFLGSLIFDRIDRKHAIIGSYFGFLLGTLSCALAPSYEILLASRAIAGAFGGLLSGISFAIIGDIFPYHERGTATGKLMTSFSLAAVMGVPVGLMLANRFGWHAPFSAIACVGVLGLIMALRFIPNIRTHVPSHYSGIFTGVTETIRDPNSRLALTTTFTMVLSQFVVIPFVSVYLVTNTGFPETRLPLLYALGGAFTAFSGPYVGRLCDQFGPRAIFLKTGLLFLLPVFLVTHLGISQVAITLIITTSFFVLSNSRMVPAMTIITSSVPPSRRGSFMSLNSCVQQLGAAFASVVAGLVVTLPLGGFELEGFSNTAYLSAIFGILAYFFGQKIRSIS